MMLGIGSYVYNIIKNHHETPTSFLASRLMSSSFPRPPCMRGPWTSSLKGECSKGELGSRVGAI